MGDRTGVGEIVRDCRFMPEIFLICQGFSSGRRLKKTRTPRGLVSSEHSFYFDFGVIVFVMEWRGGGEVCLVIVDEDLHEEFDFDAKVDQWVSSFSRDALPL